LFFLVILWGRDVHVHLGPGNNHELHRFFQIIGVHLGPPVKRGERFRRFHREQLAPVPLYHPAHALHHQVLHLFVGNGTFLEPLPGQKDLRPRPSGGFLRVRRRRRRAVLELHRHVHRGDPVLELIGKKEMSGKVSVPFQRRQLDDEKALSTLICLALSFCLNVAFIDYLAQKSRK
jgi:hypothetical protein